MSLKRATALLHGKLSAWHLPISCPNQNCPGGITPIQRIKKISDTSRGPHVPTLHFRQLQFTILYHAHQPTHVGIYFLHAMLP